MRRAAGFPIVRAFLAAALLVLAARAASAQEANLLIVTAGNGETPWETLFIDGVKTSLADNGAPPVKIHLERLDKLFFDKAIDSKLLARFLKKKYKGVKFDAAIAQGLEAVIFMESHWKAFGKPPTVLATTQLRKIPKSLRGGAVLLPISSDHGRALEAALALHPNTRRVVALVEDTRGGRRRLKNAKEAWKHLEGKIDFEYVTDFACDDLVARVAVLPKNTLIYFLLIHRDNTGKTIVAKDALADIAETANAPIYTHWSPLMGAGTVGGYMIGAEVAGRSAGDTVLRLLNGEKPKDIALGGEAARGFIYDWRQLKRWKIPETALPPGSDVRHREFSMIEMHFQEVLIGVFVLLIQTSLIAGLWVSRRLRAQALAELEDERGHLEQRVEERTRELSDEVDAHETVRQILTETTDDLKAVLGSAVEGIIGIDGNGYCTICNTSALALMGLRYPDEVIGKRAWSILAPRAKNGKAIDPDKWSVGKTLVDGGVRGVVNEQFQRADGTVFPVEYYVAPIYRDGVYHGAVLSFNDITARREAEAELAKARDAAEAASRAKTAFLTQMSHDLRTPLNGVVGTARLLAGEAMSDEARRLVGVIERSGERLVGTFEDILDFSQIEKGRIPVQRAPYDLSRQLSDLVALLTPIATGKGLDLVLDIDNAVPAWIVGDEKRLDRILFNLVGNAIKFTESGKVAVIVRLAGRSHASAKVDFRIVDTGPGIPKDRQDGLFKDGGTAPPERGGFGIGLAISRLMLEALGGTLSFNSAPGRGSEFRFALDLPIAEPPAVAEEPPPTDDCAGMRVLVVEDEELNRTVALGMLDRLGCEAEAVNDGRNALMRLKNTMFDAVLMDIRLPGMSGVETLLRLRVQEAGTGVHTPVIAFTAEALGSEIARFVSVGMRSVLTKPLDMDALAAALAKARNGDAQARRDAPLVDKAFMARERAMLGDENVTDLARAFKTHGASYVAELREAGDDLEWCALTAHKLAGAAGNLGLSRMVEAARDIEFLAESGDARAVAALVSELDGLLETSLDAFETLSKV